MRSVIPARGVPLTKKSMKHVDNHGYVGVIYRNEWPKQRCNDMPMLRVYMSWTDNDWKMAKFYIESEARKEPGNAVEV